MRYRQVLDAKLKQRLLLTRQLEEIRNVITNQIKIYYDLMSRTKESFYHGVGGDIYQNRFDYKTKDLNDILDSSLDSVLSAILNILRNQLAARKERINENLSISVKALVTGKMAKTLCQLSAEDLARIEDNQRYIITLARDHDTLMNSKDREIRAALYEEKENSDFLRIISGEFNDFLCNNLDKLEKDGHYRNENKDRRRFYNATLVVPIQRRDLVEAKPQIYGFLTVDSVNRGNFDLFNIEETKPIMLFGADLLALILLYLEMYDNFPDALKGNHEHN